MAHRLPALLVCCAALHVHAQTCVQVTVQDEGPGRGELVHCLDGSLPGIVDGLGRFCPRVPCDTLLFDGPDFVPQRVAWSDLVRKGEIVLARIPKALPPVEITPWPAKKDRQALAALSAVDSAQVSGFSQASLAHALADLPGVRMDERGAGGSARLSIRGSLLRSPYGTRGVKVYWGPFALTLADGSTPLELLDPMLVSSLDVVRSVGGPLYGSAPSGVLLADAPWRRTAGTTLEASAVGGSYGYYKLGVLTQVRDSSGTALTVGGYRMDNSGYRAQEATHRDQVFLTTQWRRTNTVTRAYLTLQQARWQLPGSVDSLTAQRDPRAARPYSQLIDAHITKQQVFAGLAHEQHLFGPLLLRAAVQAQVIDKLNPYGTTPAASGNKDEDIRGGGTRVSIAGDHRGRHIGFAWELGFEGLLERDDLRETGYAYAVPSPLRTDASSRVSNLNGFLSTRTRLGERTTLFADIG
ncbi:MAG TPA: Plug domain-containing protein, partial [Flavobacteriales bacterium]|nr:Plug domain-containing protein [Flavobacteriales bacterium]